MLLTVWEETQRIHECLRYEGEGAKTTINKGLWKSRQRCVWRGGVRRASWSTWHFSWKARLRQADTSQVKAKAQADGVSWSPATDGLECKDLEISHYF